MISLICGILKKKKKHIDIEKRSMAARGSRRGGKMAKGEKGTKSLL